MKKPKKSCAGRWTDHVGETAPVCTTETTASERRPSVGEGREKDQSWFGSAGGRGGRAPCSVPGTGSDGAHAAGMALLEHTTANSVHRYIHPILSSSYI